MFIVLCFLLPLAALSGWYFARKHYKQSSVKAILPISSKNYLTGLNFLLNEQPDKAVELFIQLLEVDNDTLETHFALGSLFRRRGEVDRAIRIHQNLIARPHLSRTHRLQSLLELGYDYMSAGVLDRAEALFKELVQMRAYMPESLGCLLDLYQQEREWDKAIVTAEQLQGVTGQSMAPVIANYYCELAEIAMQQSQEETALRHLKRALSIDMKSARPQLLQAQYAYAQKKYKQAIEYYLRVKAKAPEFITEILHPLAHCFEACGEKKQFSEFLKNCVNEKLGTGIAVAFSGELSILAQEPQALNLITQQLQYQPSLHALSALINFQLAQVFDANHAEQLKSLQQITSILLAKEPAYFCENCGLTAQTLYWLCPSCKQWNTTRPIC